MLERMGWSEGRGLGSKEDGKSEHVRVAKKSDTLGEQVPGCDPACIVRSSDSHVYVAVYYIGVGARRGRDDDWLEQQAAFEEVLSQLHRQHPQGGGQEGASSCLSVCLCFAQKVMSVCSAFKESSRWREGRGGRAKLFDRLGCCFTTPNVSTPRLQHAGHMCVT